jgi:DNA ligase-1
VPWAEGAWRPLSAPTWATADDRGPRPLITLFQEIAAASRDVAALTGRLAKVERLAELLARLSPEEVPIAVAYLSGTTPQGRIGIGYALLQQALRAAAASGDQAGAVGAAAGEAEADAVGTAPSLTLRDVHGALDEIAHTTGSGSRALRMAALVRLFSRAAPLERSFLARLLLGELRQGALESLVLEALARASGVTPERIRRAVMLRGEAGTVGRSVLEREEAGLGEDSIELFRPVKPMLASTADGVEEALERMGSAIFEYKFDGGRVQVHKEGERVRVYTRRLNDETDALPEIADWVRALPAASLVLDGEALALGPDRRPRPFQETMRRFGRKRDVALVQGALPLTPFFFDILLLDGAPLIDLPASERVALLESSVPVEGRSPRISTSDPEEAREFLACALAAGHEGLMAKDLAAPYVAGRRGRAWLKIKPALTADLVVLAAEWGHGRRQGWLSNLHLGARGAASGEWIMVGKTFKGMTDELLRWQTERLQGIAVGTVPGGVRVRPELVVEVEYEGVQGSPRYPGGIALRFARVKGYRPDKAPEEADTVESLRRSGRS